MQQTRLPPPCAAAWRAAAVLASLLLFVVLGQLLTLDMSLTFYMTLALAAFLLWMGLTALTMNDTPTASIALQILVDASFALACAGGCFFMLAACLRFGVRRSPIFDSLANNAFAIYLLHYVFVVWLQYALLGVALFALAKGLLVLSVALPLSWATAIALRHIPFGPLLIGENAPARVAPERIRA